MIGDASTRAVLGQSRRALRDELEGLVRGQLLGPVGGEQEEVADARVSERYLVGMLAPRRPGLLPSGPAEPEPAPEEDAVEEELAVDGLDRGDDGTPDRGVAAVEQMVPASIGLSFAVVPDTAELEVHASWGQYERGKSDGDHETKTGEPATVWKRLPRGGERTVSLKPGPIKELIVDTQQPEVVVRGRVRDVGGQRLVSLFLVNAQIEPEQSKDRAWVFQPELRVRARDGGAVIVARKPLGTSHGDELDRADADSQDVLYRGQVELAVGHNIGTHVVPAPEKPDHAVEARTVVMPAHEVPLTEAPGIDDDPALAAAELDMRVLSETTTEALPAKLEPLVAAYDAWIERQELRLGDPSARLVGHEDAVARHLERCREAVQRLRAGIAALADPDVAEAFRAANEAMWRQRTRTIAAARRAAGDTQSIDVLIEQEDVPRNRSWRPFQLAFVLLDLPGIARLDHAERGTPGLVDLLWFPTGGGKTEAYLGLTAFTLVLRRLRGEEGERDGTEGVGVLMRYTLRLLTLQQFQRAAALVCALEAMRDERDDPRWGKTPFRLGLWVGARSTPNRTKDADEWIKRAKRGFASGQGSPAQLTRCPWCGSAIDPGKHIEVDMRRGRTVLYCGDSLGACLFSRKQRPGEGLPTLVVDEEIYR
ncbi:MAG TPA: hypothetical protein PKB03_04115, partial [Baekduia sp.]|nr:hypothetical protein [Baekduia sp.]